MNRLIVLGAPRSGTTWLGEILNASPHVAYRYQPLHAWSFPSNLHAESSRIEIDQFFDDLLCTSDPYVTQLRSSALGADLPKFSKRAQTHLVFKETHFPSVCRNIVQMTDNTKLVGLIRDPVDCLTSWWNVENEFRDRWNIEEEWLNAPSKNRGREGHMAGFMGWLEVVRILTGLRDAEAEKTLLITYESLTSDPHRYVGKLFSHVGLPVDSRVTDFLYSSTTRNDPSPYGVFRAAPVHRTRGELPARIAAEVRRRTREAGFGQFLKV